MTEEQIERAAIIEFDANKPRAVAEREAMRQRPAPNGWPARCLCAACVRAGRSTVLGG